ncbi:MAG: RNA 3'-terminal phosphate cyclase [Deltaproteobacteria bacterium]
MESRGRIEIDGAFGEGGGQILRTALSLSAITGRPFRASRVRHGRLKPGLRPQHVAAARATAAVCAGTLTGDEVGSEEISLEPREVVRQASWSFDIGTAGSAPLLFQTLCWPLALAGAPSELSLLGGTHQDHSPSFHYLALVWGPAVARLGFPFDLSLQRAGFYPEGGGAFQAAVHPARAMPPLDLTHRGTLLDTEVVSLFSGVDFDVGERQASRAERRLRANGVSCDARAVPMPGGPSRGAHLLVVARFERVRSGHSATTEGGREPDRTADAAVAAFARFLDGRGAVDPHLADQLLLPAALVAAGRVPRPPGVDRSTRFTVGDVTRHLLTCAAILPEFLPVAIDVDGTEGGEGEVRIRPLG